MKKTWGRWMVLTLLIVGMAASGSAVDGSTAVRPDDNNFFDSETNPYGVEIEPQKNLVGIKAQISSKTDSRVSRVLLTDVNGNILSSKTGDFGPGSIVEISYGLESNQNYFVSVDNQGDQYTGGYGDGQAPYTSPDIDIIAGTFNGLDSGTTQTDNLRGIKSVTAVLNKLPQFNSSSLSPDTPLIGQSVSYSAEVFDSDGSIQDTELTLEFGGSTVVSNLQSTGTNPSFDDVFVPQTGNKFLNATLEVTDDAGATTTTEINRFLSDTKPNITVNKPDTSIKASNTVSYSITTEEKDSKPNENLELNIYKNGNLQNTFTITEGDQKTGNINYNDGTGQTFKAEVVENDGDQDSETVTFDVDTSPPNLNIVNPAEDGNTNSTTGIKLDFTVEDPNLNSSTCKYSKDGGTNFSVSNCENTTVQYGSTGQHNLTLYASDTLGNTGQDTNTFTVDFLNKFTAEKQSTGTSIDSFEATIRNGTKTIGGSVTDGSFEFFTTEMPKGQVTVTVEADGFQTKNKTFNNVDQDFSQDVNFKLERAGFEAEVYDEQTNTRLGKPVEVQISNDSSTKSIYWGNQFVGSTLNDATESIDNPSNSFDGDKNTDAQISISANDKEREASFTGFVSLGETSNERIKVRYDPDFNPNDNNAHYGRLIRVEAEKNGVFNTIYEDTSSFDTFKDDEPLQTDSFNLDNSQDEYTGRVRITAKIVADDSGNGFFELNEVWANNLKKPSLDFPNYPTGQVDVKVDDNANNEYRPRNYILNLDENTKISLDSYLIEDGEGILTNIEIRGPENQPLENSLANIQKNFNGNFKTIASSETNSDGSTSFYLDPDSSYKLLASNPGFESFTGSFNPANYQFDPFKVRLGAANNFQQSNVWDSIEFKLQPRTNAVNETAKFNFSVIDQQPGITEFGIRVKNTTGSTITSKGVTGSSSGGSTTLQANLTGLRNVEVEGFFVKDSEQYKVEKNYKVQKTLNPGITSITRVAGSLGTLSNTAKNLIAVLVSGFIAFSLRSRLNTKGGSVVTMSSLGIFVILGWLPAFYWLTTFLALVGIISIR